MKAEQSQSFISKFKFHIPILVIMAFAFHLMKESAIELSARHRLQMEMVQWALFINNTGRLNPNMSINDLLKIPYPISSKKIKCLAVKAADFKNTVGNDVDFIIYTSGFIVFGNGIVSYTNVRDALKSDSVPSSQE